MENDEQLSTEDLQVLENLLRLELVARATEVVNCRLISGKYPEFTVAQREQIKGALKDYVLNLDITWATSWEDLERRVCQFAVTAQRVVMGFPMPDKELS